MHGIWECPEPGREVITTLQQLRNPMIGWQQMTTVQTPPLASNSTVKKADGWPWRSSSSGTCYPRLRRVALFRSRTMTLARTSSKCLASPEAHTGKPARWKDLQFAGTAGGSTSPTSIRNYATASRMTADLTRRPAHAFWLTIGQPVDRSTDRGYPLQMRRDGQLGRRLGQDSRHCSATSASTWVRIACALQTNLIPRCARRPSWSAAGASERQIKGPVPPAAALSEDP
jgi:hypothetical protein